MELEDGLDLAQLVLGPLIPYAKAKMLKKIDQSVEDAMAACDTTLGKGSLKISVKAAKAFMDKMRNEVGTGGAAVKFLINFMELRVSINQSITRSARLIDLRRTPFAVGYGQAFAFGPL